MSDICLFVKKIIGKARTVNGIASKLEKNKCKVIGEGSYKTVYQHSDFPEYVVKVYINDNDWQSDSYLPLPKVLSRYWVKPLYQSKQFLIQPYVEPSAEAAHIIEKKRKAAKIKWHYDIHEGNCGFLNNKPVIFDYSSPR